MDTAAAARALDLSSTAADGRQSAQQSHAALPRARDTGLRHDLVFAHAGVSRVVSAPASTTIVCTTQAPKDSAAQDLETKTPQSRFINCAGGAELPTETCGVVLTGSGCGVSGTPLPWRCVASINQLLKCSSANQRYPLF
ncbi:MAG: hypothetical protein ACPIOQ_03505 [Promethearchaeia archaeon]